MKFLTRIFALALMLFGCASSPATKPALPTQPVAAASSPAATGEVVPFEGFEDDAIWMAVAGTWKDGNQSTMAQIVSGHATEGSMSLECSYQFVNDPAKKGASWMTEDILRKNWDNVKGVLVDIDNTTGKDLDFDLAVCSGDAWDWYETRLVTVPAGLNKNVRFDLTDVKSNTNNWSWGGKVLNPKTIQRVVIQVINGPAKGDAAKLYVDNLRLVK